MLHSTRSLCFLIPKHLAFLFSFLSVFKNNSTEFTLPLFLFTTFGFLFKDRLDGLRLCLCECSQITMWHIIASPISSRSSLPTLNERQEVNFITCQVFKLVPSLREPIYYQILTINPTFVETQTWIKDMSLIQIEQIPNQIHHPWLSTLSPKGNLLMVWN